MTELKAFEKTDIAVMLAFTAAWTLSASLLKDYTYTLIIITSALITLISMLTKKVGLAAITISAGSLAILASALLKIPISDKMLIIPFLAAAITFELATYFTKEHEITLMIAAAASMSTIPWTMFLLSGAELGTLRLPMLNFTILCLLSASLGSALAMLLWQFIKTKKPILRIIHG